MYVATALAVSAIPFLLVRFSAPSRVLHPLNVFGFVLMLGVFGQTTYLTLAPPVHRAALLSGEGLTILANGLMVLCIGVSFVVIGYLLGRRRAAVGQVLLFKSPDRRRLRVFIILYSAISLIGLALFAPRVGIDDLGDLLVSRKHFVDVAGGQTVFGYLRWMMALGGTASILATVSYASATGSMRRGARALLIVTLGQSLIISFIVSSRSAFLEVAVICVLTFFAAQRREPTIRFTLGFGVAAVLFLLLLGGFRLAGQGRGEETEAAFSQSAVVGELVGGRDWIDIGPFSVIVERVPDEYSYRYGRSLAAVATAPIPRSFWADKPPTRLGPEILEPVFGIHSERRTGDPPGMFGELWINGGIVAVALGSVIFGRVLRWVETLYQSIDEKTVGAAAVYGVIATFAAMRLPTTEIAATVLSVIQELVPIMLALRASTGNKELARRSQTRRPVERSVSPAY